MSCFVKAKITCFISCSQENRRVNNIHCTVISCTTTHTNMPALQYRLAHSSHPDFLPNTADDSLQQNKK